MERTIDNLALLSTAVRRCIYRFPEILVSYLLLALVCIGASGFLVAGVAGLGILIGVSQLQLASFITSESGVSHLISQFINANPTLVVAILGIIIFCGILAIVSVAVTWGFIVSDAVAMQKTILSWDNVYRSFYLAPRVLMTMFIFTISVMVGLLCLIVPGVILALSWWLFGYVLLHEESNPMHALSRSYHLMQGHRIQYFIFFALAMLCFALLNVLLPTVLAEVCSNIGYQIVGIVTALYYHTLSSGKDDQQRQEA